MPNSIVCYKWVMDEQDIKVNPSTLELATAGAKWKISEYDRNAVEAATAMQEQHGGTVHALSFGGENLKNSLKDVLSRGADSVTWIADASAADADAAVTAKVLAAAIKKAGVPDLIFFGDGSADHYSQQVGARVAALLGLPHVGNAQSVQFADGKLVAERQLRDSIETVKVACPVVVSVLPAANTARIPSLKQILAAGKKPMTAMTTADLGLAADDTTPRQTQVSLLGAKMDRKNKIFKESSVEASVAALVQALKADNVL